MSTVVEPEALPQDQAEPPIDSQTETAPRKRGGGPRTPEGREQSKRNALKHGLTARSVLPEDFARAIDQRTEELTIQFAPGNAYETLLVRDMGHAIVRLERARALKLIDEQRCIDRADLCWDSDRRADVEVLGAKLSRSPARVARGLKHSMQGIDWLLEHWTGLGDVLETNGGWDEAQRGLALDLLGVPPVLRDGWSCRLAEGHVQGLKMLVQTESGRLEERLPLLREADEADRLLTLEGFPVVVDGVTARLNRYESSARREWQWGLKELQRLRAEAQARAGVASDPSPREVDAAPAVELPAHAAAALAAMEEASRLAIAAPPEPEPAAPSEPEPAVVNPGDDMSRVVPEVVVAAPGVTEVVVPGPVMVRPAPFRASVRSVPPAPRNRSEQRIREKLPRLAPSQRQR